MKKAFVSAIILLCVLACVGVADAQAPTGFVPLFNGKDLTGWRHDAEVEKHWTVVDGVLTYDGKNDNLRTEKDYRNFILTLRWKIEKDADSGIYLRGQPQVQIWDRPVGSGGLFNDQVDPIRKADRPLGEWNHFVIIMRDKKVTVILNGVQVVDSATMNSIEGMPGRGPIELQHHGTPLWFKDIYIRELPD